MDISKYLINLDEEIVESQPIYSIGDAPVLSKGNISTIMGHAKVGKGFLITLLISDILKNDNNATILVCDTEQAKSHVIKAAKRVTQLLECEPNEIKDKLKVFTFRELSYTERIEAIETAIKKFNPILCIIDGVRDLVGDFNSPKESSELVSKLMKLSSECNNHICTIIHMNKSDSNARGHLGTELMNKSESVISIAKNNKIMKVSPGVCRNIDFPEFCIKINDAGLPEHCDPPIKSKKSEDLESLFNDILSEDTALNYTDLHTKIMEKCKIKKTAAENKIKNAIEQGIIIKDEKTKKYYISTEQTEQENSHSTDE